VIQSLDNPKIKIVRQLLRSAHTRRKSDVFVLENPKHVQDWIRQDLAAVTYVILQEGTVPPSGCPDDKILTVSASIFDKIVDVPSPQGCLALIQKPRWEWDVLLGTIRRLLVLDGIQDPANVGAIVRSAAAFGWDAIYGIGSTADPYHPKAVRAMAATLGHIPFLEGDMANLKAFHQAGGRFYGLDAKKGRPLSELESGEKMALVLGSEGRGISQASWADIPLDSVRIPLAEGVDSLNVAVCAGIACYVLACD